MQPDYPAPSRSPGRRYASLEWQHQPPSVRTVFEPPAPDLLVADAKDATPAVEDPLTYNDLGGAARPVAATGGPEILQSVIFVRQFFSEHPTLHFMPKVIKRSSLRQQPKHACWRRLFGSIISPTL